jgi:threonine dehydrogenase-like Zn-dependent dehydrogenase
MRATVMYGAGGGVGVPQDALMPSVQPTFFTNITIAGVPSPARAYIEELLPDVLDREIKPSRVFDWAEHLENVPTDYQAMNDRKAIKAIIEF